jgi:hypothetical protein
VCVEGGGAVAGKEYFPLVLQLKSHLYCGAANFNWLVSLCHGCGSILSMCSSTFVFLVSNFLNPHQGRPSFAMLVRVYGVPREH